MHIFIRIDRYDIQVISEDKDIISALSKRWMTNHDDKIHHGKTISLRIDPLLKNNKKVFQNLKKYLKISRLDYGDFLTMALIEKSLIRRGIFFLHGSAVVHKKHALIFLGPSGAGKTTILSRLKNQSVLSEDTIVIQKQKNKYFIIPSVFDKGLTSCDYKIPLKAVFLLRKANSDLIEQTSIKNYLENMFYNDILITSGIAEKEIQRILIGHLFLLVTHISGYILNFKKEGLFPVKLLENR